MSKTSRRASRRERHAPRTIALVMIVRDEERCIARCLDSVRPHVDEMIVLDTGSVDRTCEIAREHGARVHEFTWVDDFAAARNAALDLSTADWNLVLDADEWLESGGEFVASLRQQPAAFVGSVQVVSELDTMSVGRRDDGSLSEAILLQASDGRAAGQSVSSISRLLPRDVRYEGRIHEQPRHRHPVRPVPLKLGHDGYRSAQAARKRGRNRELLEAELAASPGNAYIRFQLARDYDAYGEFAQAADRYAGLLAEGISPAFQWHHTLVIRALTTLRLVNRLPEALDIAEAHRETYRRSPDFHLALGDILLDSLKVMPSEGPVLLQMIEQAWTQALRIGERPELSGTTLGSGSFMPAHNLWAFHHCQGHVEQAAHFRALSDRLREAHEATQVASVKAPAAERSARTESATLEPA